MTAPAGATCTGTPGAAPTEMVVCEPPNIRKNAAGGLASAVRWNVMVPAADTIGWPGATVSEPFVMRAKYDRPAGSAGAPPATIAAELVMQVTVADDGQPSGAMAKCADS